MGSNPTGVTALRQILPASDKKAVVGKMQPHWSKCSAKMCARGHTIMFPHHGMGEPSLELYMPSIPQPTASSLVVVDFIF